MLHSNIITALFVCIILKQEVSAVSKQQLRNSWTTEEILAGPPKADDKRIIEFLKDTKNRFLIPPSNKPYNLRNSNPKVTEQARIVQQILNNQKNGFFIDCGAHNGIHDSNTLALEKNYGWKGLLIEASPRLVKKLLEVNRKAWVSPTCLSPKSYAVKLPFGNAGGKGAFSRLLLEFENSAKPLPKYFKGSDRFVPSESSNNPQVFKPKIIQCFPLATLLFALDVDTVDYFSLDVEGNELDVLQTIPFDKIQFKVLTVEYRRKKDHDTKTRDTIVNFMKQHGFYVLAIIISKNAPVDDLVLVHKSVDVPNFTSPYRIDNANQKTN